MSEQNLRFAKYSYDENHRKKIMQEYDEFKKSFLLHFPNSEQKKICGFLDDAIEMLDETDIHVYPDFLWNELFTQNVQNSGKFAYQKFNSLKELELWDKKIAAPALMIIKCRDKNDFDMNDFARINETFTSHLINDEENDKENNHGSFFVDFKADKNAKKTTYHILYYADINLV